MNLLNKRKGKYGYLEIDPENFNSMLDVYYVGNDRIEKYLGSKNALIYRECMITRKRFWYKAGKYKEGVLDDNYRN